MHYFRSLCFLLVFICLSFQNFGQVKVGVSAGVNLSYSEVESVTPSSSLLRYNAGIKTPILFDKFYFSPALKYSVEGWSFVNFDNTKGQMNLHYMDLQLLAGHLITENLSVEVGGEYGYLLKTRRHTYDMTFDNFYEKLNLSVILGIGYAINTDIEIDLKYIHGLSYLYVHEVTDNTGSVIWVDRSIFLRVLQLSCSYYFL